jgi:arsenate reductase
VEGPLLYTNADLAIVSFRPNHNEQRNPALRTDSHTVRPLVTFCERFVAGILFGRASEVISLQRRHASRTTEMRVHVRGCSMRLTVIRTIAIAALGVLWSSPTQCNSQAATGSQILFVCEHGNVKSLMAASYFNQLAQERQLPFRAVARGTKPDSTTVPPVIVQELHRDGFDVSTFHPSKVSLSDVSTSEHVVLIGTTLPPEAQEEAVSKMEQWNDVPPANVDYGATRESLKGHVKKLVEQLMQRKR